MKNILKNTKNIKNYTKQPIAQIKKNMLGIVKSVQKKKRNISKLYIDTVGLSCYTRTIEQPIAQKRSPEIKLHLAEGERDGQIYCKHYPSPGDGSRVFCNCDRTGKGRRYRR